MKISLPSSTFKSYGGGSEYSPLIFLIETATEDFGPGVREIELTLFHRSALPFSKQGVDSSLSSSYREFHQQTLAKLPASRYLRKKGIIKLSALAEFATAEETRVIQSDFQLGWQHDVLDILIARLEACRSKFKSSDEFRLDQFLTWLNGLHEELPATQAEARAMDQRWRDKDEEEWDTMSEWDRLGIDFDEFHPQARTVLDDPCLWSTGHEFSPNGSDNGADLISLFRKQKSRIKKNEGRAFLKKMARDWGFDPGQPPDDSIEYLMKRQVVIGLAFAFMKYFAFCPQWLADEATTTIQAYQEFLKSNHLDWEHRAECLDYQKRMLKYLKRCPREEPSIS